jgi:triacylglycerol lipase
MNPLGLVQAAPVGSGTPPTAALQLRIFNVLAGSHRLWLRGRLTGLPLPSPQRKPWWKIRSTQTVNSPPLLAKLETHLGGKELSAEIPVMPDGYFEAAFPVELAPARRGWRVARNRVEINGQSAESCSVVMVPPLGAAGVVVVLLPPIAALAGDGRLSFERSLDNPHLAQKLHWLNQGPRGGNPLYYLADLPGGAEGTTAELALILAALAWPSGSIVPLPGDTRETRGYDAALDRLRWLFAGDWPIQLINLDSRARPFLDHWQQPAPDRALVRCLLTSLDELQAPPKTAAGDGPRLQPTARRPSRGGLLTRYPLVFCHGLLANTMLRMQLSRNYNYFALLGDFLEKRGFQALFPMVPPTGSVNERATQLRDQIVRWTDGPVNIIAHSMGGLDARYMIGHLDMADRVKSLTTISTPHRGSWVADWFLANYRRRVPLLLALEALGVNVTGIGDCRRDVCLDFNARTPDAAAVRYFSYVGAVPQVKVSPMLRRSWALLHAEEGPNDGLVSVTSARWGEHLGTIYADHFAQTPDGVWVHPGETFDSLGFFHRLVEDLARRGL